VADVDVRANVVCRGDAGGCGGMRGDAGDAEDAGGWSSLVSSVCGVKGGWGRLGRLLLALAWRTSPGVGVGCVCAPRTSPRV